MLLGSRRVVPGLPLHVVQRAVGGAPCFLGDDDRAFYRDQLGGLAAELAIALHAYVLMGDHVHLLLTPRHATGPALLMRNLGQRHARRHNRIRGCSRALWEGRYRSCLVQADTHLLACMRYIELNPVRAGLVRRARDWRWSSHAANADGLPDTLVTPHETWLALGADDAARRLAYRAQVDAAPNGQIAAIRAATRAEAVLGDRRFAIEVEAMLGRRLAAPRRSRSAETGSDLAP